MQSVLLFFHDRFYIQYIMFGHFTCGQLFICPFHLHAHPLTVLTSAFPVVEQQRIELGNHWTGISLGFDIPIACSDNTHYVH